MITVYGKSDCVFCENAKLLLDMYNVDYEYKQLDTDYTKEELLKLNPAAKSFPQIFNEDRLIGGFEDLRKKLIGA